MAKQLQHRIEALHRLVTLEDNVPLVVFTRDEQDEETFLPSGKFEIFWYFTYNDQFYGSTEVLADLADIERDVELMVTHAKETLAALKTK
jgi:hypothetical protein